MEGGRWDSSTPTQARTGTKGGLSDTAGGTAPDGGHPAGGGMVQTAGGTAEGQISEAERLRVCEQRGLSEEIRLRASEEEQLRASEEERLRARGEERLRAIEEEQLQEKWEKQNQHLLAQLPGWGYAPEPGP